MSVSRCNVEECGNSSHQRHGGDLSQAVIDDARSFPFSKWNLLRLVTLMALIYVAGSETSSPHVLHLENREICLTGMIHIVRKQLEGRAATITTRPRHGRYPTPDAY
ncbi:hypothetical protein KGM_211972 [Danaus plexippus plexippus]|uniref:Uncharacterized protein n=1 Tax=Danaus plexippus plexippus TaxID=278856 RepID=A0A212EMC0_DANPL|nr:hypothetical protein KGM_211972 [Danaus plexippus plexippus]